MNGRVMKKYNDFYDKIKKENIFKCKICFVEKKLEFFPSTKTGIRFECKECHYKKSAQRYRNSPRLTRIDVSRESVIQSIKNITDRPNQLNFLQIRDLEFMASPEGEIYKFSQWSVLKYEHADKIVKNSLTKRGYYVISGGFKQIYSH